PLPTVISSGEAVSKRSNTHCQHASKFYSDWRETGTESSFTPSEKPLQAPLLIIKENPFFGFRR
ncbi:hypothetical protein, partial [Acetobacter orleanensis]